MQVGIMTSRHQILSNVYCTGVGTIDNDSNIQSFLQSAVQFQSNALECFCGLTLLCLFWVSHTFAWRLCLHDGIHHGKGSFLFEAQLQKDGSQLVPQLSATRRLRVAMQITR